MGNSNCGAKRRAQQQAQAHANRRIGAAASSADPYSAASNSLTDSTGAYSSGYGAGSGYVYAMMCPEGIDQDVALLATAAALAVGIYVVYRQVEYVLL